MSGDRSVLVDNLTTVSEISEHFDVHWNTIYLWRKERRKNGFPTPLRKVGQHELYDYAEVYTWFQGWVVQHPGRYKFQSVDVS